MFVRRVQALASAGVHRQGCRVGCIVGTYKGFDVFLAAKNDLGHVLNLERSVGALAGQILRASRLVVMDGMPLEAGLDREVILDSGKTSYSRG